LEGTVGQLSVEDGLRLLLGTGVEILIQDPFHLKQDGSDELIRLSSPSGTHAARQLLDQTLQRAYASWHGSLHMSFGKEGQAELTLIAGPGSWHINLPGGSQCWAIEGGGIGLFPPRIS
jgi:hypothetical protein